MFDLKKTKTVTYLKSVANTGGEITRRDIVYTPLTKFLKISNLI